MITPLPVNASQKFSLKNQTVSSPRQSSPPLYPLLLVESKSMKLYLETFRNEGVFHEHLAVDIGKDFARFVQPISLTVTAHFHMRGGIAISVTYTHEKAKK